MNKNAIKTFAVTARKNLIGAVKKKAYEYGIDENGFGERTATVIGGRPLSNSEIRQREKLVAIIQTAGFEQVMEEAAYTWFNRFIALRYMEVNRYLPSRIRVFTNEAGEFDPEILKRTDELDFIAEDDKPRLYEFIENSDNEGLFKFLIIAQCNALHALLPAMFEEISDYTELLFPSNLLLKTSVLAEMVKSIPEEDWQDQVQIIGWLYQFYNSEFKDETYALLKRKVKLTKERIPAVTQLFTPDWIVRYMVENSLGRLWLEGHPDETMQSEWKYYLEEAEQEAEVQAQLDAIKAEYAAIRPEEIKVMDPSMGSGHILVYAFDVLMQIYLSQGWNERDAAKSIVENNLYGIDIDERAYQLAYFAVMMKARSYSRRILTQDVQCNLCAIRESNGFDQSSLSLFGKSEGIAKRLVEEFIDAKEYGSILIIKASMEDLTTLQKQLQEIEETEYETYLEFAYKQIVVDSFKPLLKQAIALVQKYDVVVTNPPYMGSGNMTLKLNSFVKSNYPDSKSDMSTVFMEKCLSFCKDTGYSSMINIPVWMFLSSYETLRNLIISNNTIVNMVHPGRGIFGSDFGTTIFVIQKKHCRLYRGSYRRLFEKQGEVKSIDERKDAFLNGTGKFYTIQDDYKKIPGSPIAYWVSESIFTAFEKNKTISEFGQSSKGIITGNNDKYLRQWWEVLLPNINFCCEKCEDLNNTSEKWYPCCKGGDSRKWYGNLFSTVDWQDNGHRIMNNAKVESRHAQDYYDYIKFRPTIGWSSVTSGKPTFRYYNNCLAEHAGMVFYMHNEEDVFFYLALLNSTVSKAFLQILSPTINYNAGEIGNIPIIKPKNTETINSISELLVNKSKIDWDSFETSWDFKKHPLV